jgi:coenzyme F420-reducing hydrogenase delta subunit
MSSTSSDEGWAPNIVGFLCRWCSSTGADLAGTTRQEYPPNVKIMKVPCTSSIKPHFVIHALAMGADGVLISGCHPGNCHHVEGNYRAKRRIMVLRRLLEFMGVDPERLQMSWVSAAEGAKWVDVVTRVTEKIWRLGPNRIFQEEAH